LITLLMRHGVEKTKGYCWRMQAVVVS
jgi:hypothetical protein